MSPKDRRIRRRSSSGQQYVRRFCKSPILKGARLNNGENMRSTGNFMYANIITLARNADFCVPIVGLLAMDQKKVESLFAMIRNGGNDAQASMQQEPTTAKGVALEQPGKIVMLASLIERLQQADFLEGDLLTTFEAQNKLQKHAYIAKTLGVPLHYEFNFLENGAFSTDMSIDIYETDGIKDTIDPFGQMPGAFETFVDLARGRGSRWLQAITFALRDLELDDTDDEFAARVMHGSRLYEKKMLKRVFAHVRDRMREHGACAPSGSCARRGDPGAGSEAGAPGSTAGAGGGRNFMPCDPLGWLPVRIRGQSRPFH